MKDVTGKEIKLNDKVFFGETVRSKGGRGTSTVGVVTELNRFVYVNGDKWSGMQGSSVRVVSEKFYQMYRDKTIFDI